MNVSENGLNLIKKFEELVLHPYLDSASVPTIGYGSTYYPGGKRVTMRDAPITEEEANTYLNSAVASTVAAVNNMLVISRTSQNNFDALVDFAYNLGIGALHGSTLLKLINANPMDPAITTAFKMWDKVHIDGELKPSSDLLARREEEAALYFS